MVKAADWMSVDGRHFEMYRRMAVVKQWAWGHAIYENRGGHLVEIGWVGGSVEEARRELLRMTEDQKERQTR